MINGLWTIEFSSVLNRFGSGVLVLKDGLLLGGDNGYYYSGKYNVKNDRVEGKVAITRYDPNIISVFGNMDQFSLSFAGQITHNVIDAIASLDGKPESKIQIKCLKKIDA